jgi:hypothetical protein
MSWSFFASLRDAAHTHLNRLGKRQRRRVSPRLEQLEERVVLFARNDLVVLRVGDGNTALSSAAAPVFLDEYDFGGGPVSTTPLPTTVSGNNLRLTLVGNDNTEGTLTRSADGNFLLLAGYDADPGSSDPSATASNSTNRVVATISSAGNVVTDTRIGDGYSSGHIRGAASTDGNKIWTSGTGSSSSGGTRYVPLHNAPTTATANISSTINDTRVVNIFPLNSTSQLQLYTSSNSGSNKGVNTVAANSAPPTSGGATTALLPGITSNSADDNAFGYVFLDSDSTIGGVDTLYVADGSNGIVKYSKDASNNWTQRGNVSGNLRGLVGYISGQNQVTLFAVSIGSGSGGSDQIVKLLDSAAYDKPISGSFVTMVTAAPKEAFRGLAFSPLNMTPGVLGSASATLYEDIPYTFSAANSNQIFVTDPDAYPNNVTVTLQLGVPNPTPPPTYTFPPHGTLTAVNTAGASISYANNNTKVTITGAPSAVNRALDGLRYTPEQDYNDDYVVPPGSHPADFLTVTIDDGGNTGAAGAQTATLTIDLHILPVNDAPTVTGPTAVQNVNENGVVPTSLIFKASSSNAIQVGDVDDFAPLDHGKPEQVTLSVAHGTLTFLTTVGLTFDAGNPNGSATVVVTGSIDNLNTALDNGLKYVPDKNYPSSAQLTSANDTVTVVINDLGNTGVVFVGSPPTPTSPVPLSGTTTQPITIAIAAVNQPPAINGPASVGTNENAAFQFSGASAVTITDPDGGPGPVNPSPQEKVSLSVQHGRIHLASTTGITFLGGSVNNSGSMTFTGTLASIANALNSGSDFLTYTPNTGYTGPDKLSIVVNDQGNFPAPATQSAKDIGIGVAVVNLPPVITAPSATQNIVEDNALTLSAANNNLISVNDPDPAGPEQVTVTAANGKLTLTAAGGATVTGIGTGNLVLTGELSDLNTALDGLIYTPNADFTGTETLMIHIDDQNTGATNGAQTDDATVTINISPVNDAPTITAPTTVNATQDTPFTFSTAGDALVVADVDANGGSEKLSLAVSHGTLMLASTSGLTFNSGANGSAAMTVTGTLANLNAALDGMVYMPATGFIGAETLVINLDDQGNSGSGGALSAPTANVAIDVIGVNQAPTIVAPASINATEDAPFTFSGGAITLTDIDAFSGQETLSLMVSHGTLTLASTTGLTFNSGANGSAAMTVTGTLANLNAALNGMQYLGNSLYFGPDTLAITLDDNGNTGTGGPQSATPVNVHIDVAPVNHAPTITSTSPQVTTTENTNFTFANVLTIADVDGASDPHTATLSVGHGTLTPIDTPGVTINNPGTATVTLIGTPDKITEALNGMVYAPNAGFDTSPESGQTETLSISVTDAGFQGLPPATGNGSVGINVTPVNNPPVITSSGATVNVNEDTSVSLAAANLQVSDPDGYNTSEQLTLTADHGTVTLTALTGLTVVGGSNGSSNVIVTGTLANLNAALAGVNYKGNQDYNGPDTVHAVIDDLGHTGGGNLTDTVDVSIVIAAVNDAPVHQLPPAGQNTPLNTNLVFSTAGGNAIVVSDVDANGGDEQVTLSVTTGTLTLASTSGLTINSGANGSAAMTVTGTLANLNAALNGLTFTPPAGFTGKPTVSISTNDLGNSGTGGAQTTNNSFDVVVNPDHAPVNTVPPAQTIDENNPLVFSTTNGTAITVSDNPVDTGSDDYRVTLTATHGTLTLGSTAGLNNSTGNGTANVIFDGPLAAVNAALAGLRFDPTLNYFGPASVAIKTDESLQTNVGFGGPLDSGTNTIAITVNFVNQPPVGVADSFSLGDGRTLTVGGRGVLVNDFDVDSPTITAQLVSGPSNGTVVLNADGSFTYSRNPTFIGTDSFTYRPTDGQALGNVTTVTIHADIPFNQVKAWVEKVYLALLHRPVNPGELSMRLGELSSGLSRAQVALNVMDGQEYRTVVVQDLIKALLNRQAKAREIRRFTSLLEHGQTVEFVSALVIGTPEYIRKHGGLGRKFVRSVFRYVQGLDPSRRDLALYTRLLAGGRSPTNIAVRLYQTHQAMVHTATTVFQKYMGRPPHADELASLVRLLETGITDQPTLFAFQLPSGSRDEQLAAIILGSPEFFANV